MQLLPEYAITKNSIHHIDLFALCNAMPDNSIDMILCDLPYGTTACAWDTIIPIEPMWQQFKRIIKPRGAIVLTASQPFTSRLVSSNYEMFRYEWIYQKSNATRFLDCNRKPMLKHENVLIFGQRLPNYYPQMETGKPYVVRQDGSIGYIFDKNLTRVNSDNDGQRYPKTIIKVDDNQKSKVHPTQKPVALFEYLIKTYTQPGELVFDPCVGSGTTAVAARNTGRDYICGDFTRKYVELARERLQNSDPYQHSIDKKTGLKQLSLFAS